MLFLRLSHFWNSNVRCCFRGSKKALTNDTPIHTQQYKTTDIELLSNIFFARFRSSNRKKFRSILFCTLLCFGVKTARKDFGAWLITQERIIPNQWKKELGVDIKRVIGRDCSPYNNFMKQKLKMTHLRERQWSNILKKLLFKKKIEAQSCQWKRWFHLIECWKRVEISYKCLTSLFPGSAIMATFNAICRELIFTFDWCI